MGRHTAIGPHQGEEAVAFYAREPHFAVEWDDGFRSPDIREGGFVQMVINLVSDLAGHIEERERHLGR